jgi:hypothetical protein
LTEPGRLKVRRLCGDGGRAGTASFLIRPITRARTAIIPALAMAS